MTLEEHINAIEDDDRSQRARILLLLLAHREIDQTASLDFVRLAYLDYFMRYPASLEKVLRRRGKATAKLKIEEFERTSIEAQYGALRIEPWDAEYRRWLAAEFSAGRLVAKVQGDDFSVSLTDAGIAAATRLRDAELFAVMFNRALIVARNLDLQTRTLRKIIDKYLPETISQLRAQVE